MFESIKKMLSGNSGDLDEARVAAMLLVLMFIAGAVATVFKTGTLDFQQFGIGVGSLGAGVGVWMGGRKDN